MSWPPADIIWSPSTWSHETIRVPCSSTWVRKVFDMNDFCEDVHSLWFCRASIWRTCFFSAKKGLVQKGGWKLWQNGFALMKLLQIHKLLTFFAKTYTVCNSLLLCESFEGFFSSKQATFVGKGGFVGKRECCKWGRAGLDRWWSWYFSVKLCTIRNFLLLCENVVPLFAKVAFVGKRGCEQKKVWQIRRNGFA